MPNLFSIRTATPDDVPLILSFIKDLADYEKLPHEVTATEDILRRNLFAERRGAEVLLASERDVYVGFALFFYNFSSFLGKPGIYLEDVFVRPEFRGRGYGKALMIHIARLAKERDCGRFEWSVLDWNEPSLEFYRSLGAVPMSEWTAQRMSADALDRLAGQKLPGEIT
ncbi:MAG: GNAT family N-acetyltransferase [Verrucomicrobia bacterium]|nr:GNAT family N-acetyltransferase [Verrucomicrobiota bacterium]